MKCDSDIYFGPAPISLPINYDLIPTLALLGREVRRSHDKNTIMMASPFLALLRRPKAHYAISSQSPKDGTNPTKYYRIYQKGDCSGDVEAALPTCDIVELEVIVYLSCSNW
jgi:hypothetical protein